MPRIRTESSTAGIPAAARPAPPLRVQSAQEEAARIVERLTELVESRRRQVAGAAAVTTAPAPSPAPADAGHGQVLGARHSGRLLGNLLVARGFLVDTELRHALAKQADTGRAIGQVVVELGYISERDLVEVLGEQLRMPVVDPNRSQSDPSIVELLPKDAARRLGAIALRRVGDRIEVAVADPTDDAAVAELTRLLGGSLRLAIAARADVDAAIERLYD